jgi:transcriptional/translational regulatory protein YebC/TACO1
MNDDSCTVYCDIRALESVKSAVEKAGLKIEDSGLEWVAKNTTELSDEQSDKVLEFLSKLQDHEDVENVYTNLG